MQVSGSDKTADHDKDSDYELDFTSHKLLNPAHPSLHGQYPYKQWNEE